MKYLFKRLGLFISDKFVPLWVKILDMVRKMTMLFTFLCMVAGMLFIAYHLFVCYDTVRVITASVFLWIVVTVNHSLQD